MRNYWWKTQEGNCLIWQWKELQKQFSESDPVLCFEHVSECCSQVETWLSRNCQFYRAFLPKLCEFHKQLLFYLVPIKKLLPQQHRARQSDILWWVRAFKELLYLTRQKSWQKCRDSIRPLCLFPQKVTKLPFSSTRVWLSLQYPFSCQKNFCWFVWILHLQQWSE